YLTFVKNHHLLILHRTLHYNDASGNSVDNKYLEVQLMDVLIRKMAHTLLYFLHLIVTLPHNLYNKILDHSLTGSSNDSPHFISGSDFIKAFITFNSIKRFNFVFQASEFKIGFTNIERTP